MISKVNRSKRFKSIEIKIHSARDRMNQNHQNHLEEEKEEAIETEARLRERARERASASESRQHATLSFWKKLLCRVAATNL